MRLQHIVVFVIVHCIAVNLLGKSDDHGVTCLGMLWGVKVDHLEFYTRISQFVNGFVLFNYTCIYNFL